MRMNLRRSQLVITATATCLVLAFYFLSTNLLPRLESLEQDTLFAIRGPLTPDKQIVIATMDEKSIDRLGRWPWPRTRSASGAGSRSQMWTTYSCETTP